MEPKFPRREGRSKIKRGISPNIKRSYGYRRRTRSDDNSTQQLPAQSWGWDGKSESNPEGCCTSDQRGQFPRNEPSLCGGTSE